MTLLKIKDNRQKLQAFELKSLHTAPLQPKKWYL
jgi:hypothetical protein